MYLFSLQCVQYDISSLDFSILKPQAIALAAKLFQALIIIASLRNVFI